MALWATWVLADNLIGKPSDKELTDGVFQLCSLPFSDARIDSKQGGRGYCPEHRSIWIVPAHLESQTCLKWRMLTRVNYYRTKMSFRQRIYEFSEVFSDSWKAKCLGQILDNWDEESPRRKAVEKGLDRLSEVGIRDLQYPGIPVIGYKKSGDRSKRRLTIGFRFNRRYLGLESLAEGFGVLNKPEPLIDLRPAEIDAHPSPATGRADRTLETLRARLCSSLSDAPWLVSQDFDLFEGVEVAKVNQPSQLLRALGLDDQPGAETGIFAMSRHPAIASESPADSRIIAVSGRAGTGKTVACYQLLKELYSDGVAVFVTAYREKTLELVNLLVQSLARDNLESVIVVEDMHERSTPARDFEKLSAVLPATQRLLVSLNSSHRSELNELFRLMSVDARSFREVNLDRPSLRFLADIATSLTSTASTRVSQEVLFSLCERALVFDGTPRTVINALSSAENGQVSDRSWQETRASANHVMGRRFTLLQQEATAESRGACTLLRILSALRYCGVAGMPIGLLNRLYDRLVCGSESGVDGALRRLETDAWVFKHACVVHAHDAHVAWEVTGILSEEPPPSFLNRAVGAIVSELRERVDPELLDLALTVGENLRNRGRLNEAIEVFREIQFVEREERRWLPVFRLGLLECEAGFFVAAGATFTRMRALPQHGAIPIHALSGRGMALCWQLDPSRAGGGSREGVDGDDTVERLWHAVDRFDRFSAAFPFPMEAVPE